LWNRLKERDSKNKRFILLHERKPPSHSAKNPKTDRNGNLFAVFAGKRDEDVIGIFDLMLQGRLDRYVNVLAGFEALDGDLPILSHHLDGIADDVDKDLGQDGRVNISEGKIRGEARIDVDLLLPDFGGDDLYGFIYNFIYGTLLRSKLNGSQIVLDPL